MKYDFLILTPTHNRAKHLEREVLHLREEVDRRGYRVFHIIVDDASDRSQRYPERALEWKRTKYGVKLIRNKHNNGRDRFWRTYDRLIKEARQIQFHYCIALVDDAILCRDFLYRTRRHFDFCRQQDLGCVGMNIFSRFPTNWGSMRYVDCAFICSRQFFSALNWQIEPISGERFSGSKQKQHRSSGVGQQMTRNIALGPFRIAPVSGVSYMKCIDTPSVMYPPDSFEDRPPSAPWECNFIDD